MQNLKQVKHVLREERNSIFAIVSFEINCFTSSWKMYYICEILEYENTFLEV